MYRKYWVFLRLMLMPLTAPCAGCVWLQRCRYRTWCCVIADWLRIHCQRMSFARRGVNWGSVASMFRVGSVKLSRWMSFFRNFLAGKALAQLCTDSAATANKCWCPKCKARAHRENWQTLARESQGCEQLAALALAQGRPATKIHCVDMKSLWPWHVLEQASPAPVLVAERLRKTPQNPDVASHELVFFFFPQEYWWPANSLKFGLANLFFHDDSFRR